jgi:hypothetical protein
LLANDTDGTIKAAAQLHRAGTALQHLSCCFRARAGCPFGITVGPAKIVNVIRCFVAQRLGLRNLSATEGAAQHRLARCGQLRLTDMNRQDALLCGDRGSGPRAVADAAAIRQFKLSRMFATAWLEDSRADQLRCCKKLARVDVRKGALSSGSNLAHR